MGGAVCFAWLMQALPPCPCDQHVHNAFVVRVGKMVQQRQAHCLQAAICKWHTQARISSSGRCTGGSMQRQPTTLTCGVLWQLKRVQQPV